MAKQSTKLRATSLPKPESLSSFSILPKSFYDQPSALVARLLLGKYLVRELDGLSIVTRIVETEAYEGASDPASHAYRGPTRRNQAMFEQGGVLYVYFSYGVHHCMNVVTGRKGVGEAVLLRALEPLGDYPVLYQNRALRPSEPARQLLSGPGKICQALRVDLQMNLHDLTQQPLRIFQSAAEAEPEVVCTPRIGISRAREALLRFCLKNSQHLSRRLAPSGL